MDKKGISIYKLSQKAAVKYEIVKKYYNDENIGFYADILAKFCYVLDCQIADLIEYVPVLININENNH